MDSLNVTTEILSVEEARRRLPEVREHVTRVMEISAELRRIVADQSGPEGLHAQEVGARMQELDHEFRESLEAMNALGACLKDPETGLIDFYSWRGNEMVFLCWRHGEGDITHWHGIEEGFAGRKPLDED